MISFKWKRYIDLAVFNARRPFWITTGAGRDKEIYRSFAGARLEGRDVGALEGKQAGMNDTSDNMVQATAGTDTAYVEVSGNCLCFGPAISDGLMRGQYGMSLVAPGEDYVNLGDWCKWNGIKDMNALVKGMLAMWVRDYAKPRCAGSIHSKQVDIIFPDSMLDPYIDAVGLKDGDVYFDTRGMATNNARLIMNRISNNRRRY